MEQKPSLHPPKDGLRAAESSSSRGVPGYVWQERVYPLCNSAMPGAETLPRRGNRTGPPVFTSFPTMNHQL
jgi:hypothetical protein